MVEGYSVTVHGSYFVKESASRKSIEPFDDVKFFLPKTVKFRDGFKKVTIPKEEMPQGYVGPTERNEPNFSEAPGTEVALHYIRAYLLNPYIREHFGSIYGHRTCAITKIEFAQAPEAYIKAIEKPIGDMTMPQLQRFCDHHELVVQLKQAPGLAMAQIMVNEAYQLKLNPDAEIQRNAVIASGDPVMVDEDGNPITPTPTPTPTPDKPKPKAKPKAKAAPTPAKTPTTPTPTPTPTQPDEIFQ